MTFPGLTTFAVQLPGSLPKVGLTCNCEPLMKVAAKVALPAGVLPTAGHDNKIDAPLTKPLPYTLNVCPLFDPVTGDGETLVMVGTGELMVKVEPLLVPPPGVGV